MPEERWAEMELRLEDLKRKVDALQKQQEKLTEGVQELIRTFQGLAIHMGVTTDQYQPSKSSGPPPGFA
jgi:beta-phosphoglucomutase-like phosphatase (HAD superfamily)